jgi:sugar fermentation stimulation protein A
MRFESALQVGVLQSRYKRFFADVLMPDGCTITVHCANTGTMRGCSAPGSAVAISLHGKAGRKLPGTLELVEVAGAWVGVHPLRANRIVAEACEVRHIPRWSGLSVLRREVGVPGCASRFDLELGDAGGARCLVEVKSVSWADDGVGRFPDAKSERARRHADELATLARAGVHVAMLFCVQRGDVREVRPAWAVDPAYGKALVAAREAGVALLAFACDVSLQGIALAGELPVVLDL